MSADEKHNKLVDGAVTDFPSVTRFEVTDWRTAAPVHGRALVAYDVQVQASLQDGERTLKIFLRDREDL